MMNPFEDSERRQAKDRALIQRLSALLAPRWGTISIALLIALISAAAQLAVPWLTMIIIDDVLLASPDDALSQLWWLGGAIALAGLVSLLAGAAQSWLIQHASQGVLHDLRRRLTERLLSLPAGLSVRQPVGKLLTRAVNDPGSINDFIGGVAVEMFRDILVILGCGAVLWWLDWRLFLVTAAALPLLAIVAEIFRRVVAARWRSLRAAMSRLNTRMAETLGGLDELQLAGAQARSRHAYSGDNRDEFQDGMRLIHAFAVFQPAFFLITAAATVAALWAGNAAVSAETAQVGAVVAAVGYVELVFAPVRQMAEKFNLLQSALASVERTGAVLDTAPETNTGTHELPATGGTIHFEDVWFAYPQDTSGNTPEESSSDQAEPVWVLRGVTLTLAPGEHLAVVGGSGAGKSTLIALLLRLYRPNRGTITLDGVPIDQFDLTAWRQAIGLVQQEAALMAGSVVGNVTTAVPEAEHATIEQAIAATGLDGFSDGGRERMLGEGGAGLSTGERQLVSLARALAGTVNVVILDEATAHIDSLAEARIQAAIDTHDHRSMLVVAHRLATVRKCDCILMMADGMIQERGTYQELIAANGAFAALERAHRGELNDADCQAG